jgi:hypothetical protein
MQKKSLQILSLGLLAASLSFQACKKDSSEVDPNRIKTEYVLVYDQNDNRTTARALFSTGMFNGRDVKLNEGASIQFNGASMDYRYGGTYERTFTGILDSGVFVYNDNMQRSFTNKLYRVQPIDYPNYFNAVTRGQSMDIVWSGNALQAGERVELKITNTSSSDSSVTFTVTNPGATSVFIDGNQLFNRLRAGNARAVLQRYRLEGLEQGTPEGGSRNMIYQVRRDIVVY